MKPFNFKDWPPKVNNEPKSPLEKTLARYSKQHSIKPEAFKSLFLQALRDIKFHENAAKVALLLHDSTDEEGFGDENVPFIEFTSKYGTGKNLSDVEYKNKMQEYENKYQKKFENEFVPKAEQYIVPIFETYKSGNFGDKIKVLKFLVSSHNMSPFTSSGYVGGRMKTLTKDALNQEIKPDGNYYLYLHIKSLLAGLEKVSTEEIAPRVFVYKKPGTNLALISKPEDYEKVLDLRSQIVKKNQELSDSWKAIENASRKIDEHGNESTKVDLREDTEEVRKYHQVNQELQNLTKEMLSLFTTELSDEYFMTYTTKGANTDFDDHQFFLYKSVRDDFEEKSGFPLNATSVPEQYNFFEYTKDFTNQ